MNQQTNSSAPEIQSLFDRIAPVYDQLNQWLSLGQHSIWKQMTVKWSNPHLGDRGLDICCGSGDLTQLLAKKVGKTGKVIGVDFSAQQLAIAKQRHDHSSPNLPIEWLQGDALNLPFANNYFDCVTMGYGLRNVSNIPCCLQEIYRVLKPSATAAILDFNHPSNPFISNFQQWYLNNVVVTIARNFGLTEEYAYINPSLAKFPTAKEQIKLAYQAGFSQAKHYAIANEMMGVLVVTK